MFEEPTQETEEKEEKSLVSIDDFDKLSLRVARVINCEKLEKSDKLLKFTLSLGDETRTVLSGIAEHYKPEDLIGKKLVLITNL